MVSANCHMTKAVYFLFAPNLPLTIMKKKIVIIVVQCDKNDAVLMCACPVAPKMMAASKLQNKTLVKYDNTKIFGTHYF